MALLIEKNETILGNIDVSVLYVRFDIHYNSNGSQIELVSRVYPSRESYDDGAYQNAITVDGILGNKDYVYDRAVDGSDLLTAMHNKFKTYLTTDIMKNVPVLDPSTGDRTYDPSTGELITEEVIDVPKFTMDSSITFIDID